MTTTTEAGPNIEERLAQIKDHIAALDVRRLNAQQVVEECATEIRTSTQRYSAIQVAATTLKGLTPLAPEQEWFDRLTAWREALCDELLTIESPIRDKDAKLRSDNLCFSI